jgi:hypothetical protein
MERMRTNLVFTLAPNQISDGAGRWWSLDSVALRITTGRAGHVPGIYLRWAELPADRYFHPLGPRDLAESTSTVVARSR